MLKARLAAVDPSTARQRLAAQVVVAPQRSASLDSLDSLSGSDDDGDAGTYRLGVSQEFGFLHGIISFLHCLYMPVVQWCLWHGESGRTYANSARQRRRSESNTSGAVAAAAEGGSTARLAAGTGTRHAAGYCRATRLGEQAHRPHATHFLSMHICAGCAHHSVIADCRKKIQ